ncbi:glycosyltransferase family 2 protein [Candidatus Daviesbacteria bacterium]|nr:glycosyltransferase family 2 protein [Candidatus Daviesbacteria bacterium]
MLISKKISVVVIAYKDEGSIEELYKRTKAVLKKITSRYEIIYVNDDSPDRSEEFLRKLAKKDKKLIVALHSRNFGAQSAFTTGMKLASGEAVVIMDGDLQDPPELIEKLVAKWLEGYQVVYGVRRKREKSMGFVYEQLYHLFYIIFNKLSYIPIPLDAGDFSLMDRKVVERINKLPEKDRFIRGLRAWVGFKQIGIKYIRPERFSGQSTNSLIKNLKWVRKAIFSFSYTPLEWVFYMAAISFLMSILAILLYIILYFYIPNSPKGFLTLLIITLFLGSIQLIVLAIIAEYLRRIFEEVKSRPSAIVKEVINKRKNDLN